MLLQRMTKKFLMIREESIGKSAIFVYHSIIVNKPNSEFVTLLRNVMDRLFGTTTLNLNWLKDVRTNGKTEYTLVCFQYLLRAVVLLLD